MPKYHIVNPKKIQQKSRKHEVVELDPFRKYLVISGASGNKYNVMIYHRSEKTIAATCNCNWGKYHPRSACSHVQAVVDEMFPDYTPSAWGNMEDAKRQHRKTKWIGDGIIMTFRKSE